MNQYVAASPRLSWTPGGNLVFGFCCLIALAGCAGSNLAKEVPSELPSSQPFEGTNLIYLDVPSGPPQAKEKMAELLQLEGFQISTEQTPDDMIATEPAGVGGGSARLYARVEEADNGSRIALWGRWIQRSASDRHTFGQYQDYPVAAGGQRRTPQWVAWRTLAQIAEAYQGANLSYDLQ